MLKAQGEYNLHITLSATFSMFNVNQVSFCAHMRLIIHGELWAIVSSERLL